MPITKVTISLDPHEYKTLKEQLDIRHEDLKTEEKDAGGQEKREMRMDLLHLEKLVANI